MAKTKKAKPKKAWGIKTRHGTIMPDLAFTIKRSAESAKIPSRGEEVIRVLITEIDQ